VSHAPQPELPRRLARLAPALLVLRRRPVPPSSAQVEHRALAIGLSVLSWLGFTALLLLLTAALTALPLPRVGTVALLAASAGLWYGLAYGLGDQPPEWAGIMASCAMIVAMAAFGQVLSWLFRDANLLPPALLVAGVVDLWGVNFGPVSQVAEHAPEQIAKARPPARRGSAGAGRVRVGRPQHRAGDIAVAALISA